MKAVVQRVSKATLSVDEKLISAIGSGLVCYLGIGKGDSDKELQWLARKVAGLRIFPDADGKMNLSVCDVNYAIMVVSQFTLYGDVRNGFRPSFIGAELPDAARSMYEKFCTQLEMLGVKHLAKGVFAADMHIDQLNCGPVTIILDSATRSL